MIPLAFARNCHNAFGRAVVRFCNFPPTHVAGVSCVPSHKSHQLDPLVSWRRVGMHSPPAKKPKKEESSDDDEPIAKLKGKATASPPKKMATKKKPKKEDSSDDSDDEPLTMVKKTKKKPTPKKKPAKKVRHATHNVALDGEPAGLLPPVHCWGTARHGNRSRWYTTGTVVRAVGLAALGGVEGCDDCGPTTTPKSSTMRVTSRRHHPPRPRPRPFLFSRTLLARSRRRKRPRPRSARRTRAATTTTTTTATMSR